MPLRPRWAALGTVAFALWLAPPASAGELFSSHVSFPAAELTQSLAVGDFDGDADPDLAVVGTSELAVLAGGPGSTFGDPTVYPAGRDSRSIVLDDFDGDGDLDLAYVNYSSDSVSVRLGGTGTSFGARRDFAAGDGPQTLATGDFNGDHDPDLAVQDDLSGKTSILLGGAGGTFGSRTEYRGLAAPVVADANGDGDPDLVGFSSGAFGDPGVAVMLGGPGGTFGAPTSFLQIDRGVNGPVAVGDFDGDEKPDLAVATGQAFVGVLTGRGDGTFTPPTYFATPPDTTPASLTPTDLNRDGDLDLAFVAIPPPGGPSSLTVVLGGPGATFGPPTVYPSPAPWLTASGDFNGDRLQDLVTGTFDPGTVSVLANTGVALDPNALAFPATPVTANSPPQAVTLTNNRRNNLSVGGVALAGADAASFATGPDACSGATVAPGDACTVQLRFGPTALGDQTAELQFSANVFTGPQSVALSGAGISQVGLSPSSIGFVLTMVGRETADRHLTVSNDGTTTLSIGGMALAGADAGAFSTNDDTCSGADLAPGATCGIDIRFRPTQLLGNVARLEVTDDAVGSPQVVPVSGSGTSPVVPRPGSIEFGPRPDSTTTPERQVTLTNVGDKSVAVSATAIAGADLSSFVRSHDRCSGATLAPGASCTVRVAFRPDGTGHKSALLQFADDAFGNTQSVGLSGTGTPGPWLTPSAAKLAFGHVRVGTTTPTKTVTLTNTGSAPMAITAISKSGAGAGDFAGPSETCTALTSLGPDRSCTVQVAFSPSATGARTAALTVEHTAPASPLHIALAGTGS